MNHRKITRRGFLRGAGLLSASALGSTLTACGTTASAGTVEEHEPITLMDGNRDYAQLIELVGRKYPEIRLEILPYLGRNTTAYMKKQLTADHVPDIYSSTQAWSGELQQAHLVDLSKYPIVEQYNSVRLNEVSVDGAVYLLPYDFSVNGIYCNISLLGRLGLPVPESFAQLLEELPALNAAGVGIADCLMNLPGYPFQYFFNTASTGYVNTLEGRQWQQDFLAGTADADALQSSVDYFQQWLDAGAINYDLGSASNKELVQHYSQNNTALLFGSVLLDDTEDSYRLLPYLSEDGRQNVYITQPSRYYGLSRHLEEPGNEQKLEDALHVLEVLSTPEGYESISGSIRSTLCSLRDFSLAEDSPYYPILTAIGSGYSAPLIYSGWESYVVPAGQKILAWIQGQASGSDLIDLLNETQQEVLLRGTPACATVTEELTTAQTAQLCGQIFMEAAGADAALISYNVYYPDVPSTQENSYGVNGMLLRGELTDEDITAFLPTGWYDTLKVITKPGAELRQMAAEGCDLRDNGRPYPYVFLTRDGQPPEDGAEYTCILCGYSKARADTLDQQDTGIVGLDAAREYFRRAGEVSSALLDDSLLISAD